MTCQERTMHTIFKHINSIFYAFCVYVCLRLLRVYYIYTFFLCIRDKSIDVVLYHVVPSFDVVTLYSNDNETFIPEIRANSYRCMISIRTDEGPSLIGAKQLSIQTLIGRKVGWGTAKEDKLSWNTSK